MKKRTRPFFTKHWPRFDGVYRSRGMTEMFVVVDCGPELDSYAVLKFWLTKDGIKTETIHTMRYGPNAFAIMCRMAQSMGNEATHREHAMLESEREEMAHGQSA